MRLAHLAVLALAGCATGTPPIEPGFDRLMGHDVGDAMKVLGNPSSQAPAGGDTVYTWYAVTTGSTFLPSQVQTSGFIGNPANDTSEGVGGSQATVATACRLRVTAGSDKKIKHIDFRGPRSACNPVSDAVEAWAKKQG
jgi:hypothetical protein